MQDSVRSCPAASLFCFLLASVLPLSRFRSGKLKAGHGIDTQEAKRRPAPGCLDKSLKLELEAAISQAWSCANGMQTYQQRQRHTGPGQGGQ